MKKLFSIFCYLLLSASIVTQAQLRDAVNDSPEGGYVFDDNGQVSGRNNAPTATMGATGVTASWTWAEYFTGGEFGTTGSLTSTHYWWSRNASSSGYPRVHLYFLFTTGTGATYSHPTEGDIPVPAKGSYTIRSSSTNMTVFNYDFKWNGSYKNSLAYGNSSSYFSNMQSGTVTVAEGADGPYIVATGKTPENYNFSCTIGSAAQYKSVSVGVNNSSMGTATISYVSGYVYTPTTHYKLNSVYRISATPNDGYMFVNWSDGSTEATRNITITGNATYTANFEAIPAGTGTITTAVNNSSYGSVTEGGEYEIGEEITITATANEGYQFYQWQDGSSTNPRTITVSGDATYTATFKALYTLTVNANNDTYGTVTGGGVYMDGTSATLTATVANPIVNSFVRWNDGNTNSERSVTVTGNTTYTAEFSALPTDTIDIPGYSTIIDETASSEHWFQVIGGNDHYEVSICINSAAISNTTYANSSFDLDYTSIIFSDINNTEHKATQARATFSRSETIYNVTAWLLYNGTVYVVKMKFDNAHVDGDTDEYAFTATRTLSDITMATNGSYPNELWINSMDYEYSAYDSDWRTTFYYSEDFQLMFVVGTGKSYIPSGVYTIDDTQNTNTIRAFNGSTNKGSYVYRSQHNSNYSITGDFYWMLRHGEAYVINPNHDSKPLYVFVNAVNSYGRKALIEIGDEPDLRQVTITATNGTVSIGCADGHGYTSEGVFSEETGDYYYQETTLTLTPDAADGYRFDHWSDATGITDNGDGTYTMTVGASDISLTAYFVADTYTLSWDANGGELSGDYTDAGSVNAGATITAPTATRAGYTFNGWSPSVPATMPDDDATYTAQWNRIEYTITYGGLNGETNTNPDTYTIESEDINLVAPGTRDGYIFAGWKDESDNTITQIAKGSTGNRTLTATWNAKSSDIVLCEDCNNAHYNTFKSDYDGETVNVTYPRQFSASKWSTMCLPFSLDLATMIANKMYGCVYEFKYATGNANVGSGVNLYFSNAKSIEAGKCYIVNANAELAAKTSFVFSGVTIDLSKDKVATLTSEGDYNKLPGYNSQGTIELVGTLRKGTLKGTESGNTYMGLKSNKIYYPNTDTGSTIWAYRGIFRSTSALNIEKMRIVVDGEDRGEIRIDNGELIIDNGSPVRKFIRNGNLYIEREGVIYDAQGKRVE